MFLFKPLIHKFYFQGTLQNDVYKYCVVRVGQWLNLLELACGKSKTIQDKKQNIPYLMFYLDANSFISSFTKKDESAV